MDAVAEKVRAEFARFEEALPDLMETLEGRWVIFLDGEVVSDHDTEDAAYHTAVDEFGVSGGFVIAKVEPIEPVVMTAGVLFGL